MGLFYPRKDLSVEYMIIIFFLMFVSCLLVLVVLLASLVFEYVPGLLWWSAPSRVNMNTDAHMWLRVTWIPMCKQSTPCASQKTSKSVWLLYWVASESLLRCRKHVCTHCWSQFCTLFSNHSCLAYLSHPLGEKKTCVDSVKRTRTSLIIKKVVKVLLHEI